MRNHMLIPVVLASLIAALPAFAENAETSPPYSQSNSDSEVQKPLPGLSDIPTMQQQGKRMAMLMEKIQEIKDPAERKRLLAEAVCPQ